MRGTPRYEACRHPGAVPVMGAPGVGRPAAAAPEPRRRRDVSCRRTAGGPGDRTARALAGRVADHAHRSALRRPACNYRLRRETNERGAGCDTIGGRDGGSGQPGRHDRRRGGERICARAATATVAGQTCTEWRTLDREAHPAVVCITDDGVLLRAGTAEQVRVSAVSVLYAPQDPAAFRVPADYARHAPSAAR